MKSIALIGLIAAGTIALAACSTQPAHQSASQQKTAQNKDTRTVCISKTPTGSHIRKAHCVTMTQEQYKEYKKAQKERRQKARDELQRMNKGQNRSCGDRC